jgi:hypothetical protein
VPTDLSANLKHPCGATGIAAIKLVAKHDAIGRLAEQLDLVLGIQGRKVSDSPPTYTWEAGVPVLEKAKLTSIVLKTATSQDEIEWAGGLGSAAAGIWQVDLYAGRQAQVAGNLSFAGEISVIGESKLRFVEVEA